MTKEIIVAKKNFSIRLKNLFKNQYIFVIIYFLLVYGACELLNNYKYRELFAEASSIKTFGKECLLLIYYFVRPRKILLNMLLYIGTFCIFESLINNRKISALLVSTMSWLFALVNYAVIQFRGSAICIADFFTIKTALNVSKGLRLKIDFFCVVSIFIFFLVNAVMFKVLNKKQNRDFLNCITNFFVGTILILIIFFSNSVFAKMEMWNLNNAYRDWGAGLSLVKMLKENLSLDMPNQYSSTETKHLLEKYDTKTNLIDEKTPNILVVMNESFSDLTEIYGFDQKKEVMSFFNQLSDKENIIEGKLHSSVFAGKTSNCEYEFLTQNTTAFLPKGSIPYQQYVFEEVPESIVASLEELDYESHGMHSWYASGYSRKKVYELFEFENIKFEEDMDDLVYEQEGYPTDESTYEQWYEIMDSKESGENNFSFIVTMQNHLPYNESSGEKYVEGNEELNVYLQRMKMSEEALKELVAYIDEYPEDTILLFFGDHQPNVGQEQYDTLVDEEEAKYIVPFLIYANYDIPEQTDVETSVNYLQSILLEAAGIPLDEYASYMKEMRESIPVITANYYIGNNGERYSYDDESSPYYEKIKEYEKVVWYYMFDYNE
ncbi:MAG: LTA synthase family protein [Clostridia bacterium]|nr:LTA synthase family protein [Clostridia bacterium]